VLSGVTQSMMTTNSVEAQTQAETELDPLIFAVIIAAAVVMLCLVAAGVMLYKWFGTDDDNENIKPYGQSTNNNDSVEIAWEDIMAEADALGPPSETSTQYAKGGFSVKSGSSNGGEYGDLQLSQGGSVGVPQSIDNLQYSEIPAVASAYQSVPRSSQPTPKEMYNLF